MTDQPKMPQATPSVMDMLRAFHELDCETCALLCKANVTDRLKKTAPRFYSYLRSQLNAITEQHKAGHDGILVDDPDWKTWTNTELGAANSTAVAMIPSGVTERQRHFLETIARATSIAVFARLKENEIKRAQKFESN